MSYNARLRRVLSFFGIAPTAHLPAEGRPARYITMSSKDYVYAAKIWIAPSVPAPVVNGRVWHSSKHRVLAECPLCERTLSAGRLHQHVATAKCYANAARAKRA